MKIMQVIIRKKNPHIRNCITSIDEYESFGEYLNLMAVERIELPFFYKIIERSYSIEEQKVLANIYDKENDISYTWFAQRV